MRKRQRVQTIEEQIREVISSIYESEVDDSGNFRSSIESRINGTNSQNKYLDTLARLLTGSEICVAVCYDEKRNRLLVASNLGEPIYAKEYFASLAKFIKNSSQENYENLIKLAAVQICHLLNKEVAKEGLIFQRKGIIDEFKKTTREYFSGTRNLSEIQDLAKEVFKEIKKLMEKEKWSEANSYWSYLSLLEDTNIVAQVVKEKKIEEKIMIAIKNNQIDYIEGKENVHAEMKIINELCQEEDQIFSYIGISKLACLPCQLTIDIINKHSNYSSAGYEFAIRGTHGGTYENWLVPSNLSVEKKQSLLSTLKRISKGEYAKKIGESTSMIPKVMTSDYVSSSSSSWTNINQSFSDQELINKWLNNNFTYQQVQEWINIGLQSTDYDFCQWLRDSKKLVAEEVLNNYNLEELKAKYHQHRAQIEIPPKQK